MVSRMLAHIDYLDESIAELSIEIERVIAPFSEEVELLDTIPGVDRRTAEVLIAEIGANMDQLPLLHAGGGRRSGVRGQETEVPGSGATASNQTLRVTPHSKVYSPDFGEGVF
jgi:transposase